MGSLREQGIVPFTWLVDHIRSTLKPSSWAGLAHFADTCRDAYRLDFWARLPRYVHVFCEKDAMAGVLSPVTREYDVALSVIRGYTSLSFAHEIAETWNQIEKPIFAYYLGDHDPSGLDLERDLREKLTRYCTAPFNWERLAVRPDDFERRAPCARAKGTDTRTQRFHRVPRQCASDLMRSGGGSPSGSSTDRASSSRMIAFPANRSAPERSVRPCSLAGRLTKAPGHPGAEWWGV
jgi:hypothetical protein